MSDFKTNRWFVRLTKTNLTHTLNEYGEPLIDIYKNRYYKIYEYNFNEIYKTLCERYARVVYIVHDKDLENIHAHFLIQDNDDIYFDELKNLMPYGQIVKQRGSNKAVIDYFLHINEKSIKKNKFPYEEKDIITNIKNFEEFRNDNGNNGEF